MTLLISAQGSVLIARKENTRPSQKRRPSRRSTIRTFSNASRRRLIELMARLSLGQVRTSFLTLTFHAPPSADEAKRAFKQFSMRLRRDYPTASAIWRMEFQTRGAIHFHLLYFNLPYIAQDALQASWMECTGEDLSILHIKLIEGGKRQAMAYTSKYLAKTDGAGSTSLENASYQHEGKPANDPGRFWGWINRNCLPFAIRHEAMVDDPDLQKYLWWYVKQATYGKGGSQRQALRLYGDDAYHILAWMVKNTRDCWGTIQHPGIRPAHWHEVGEYDLHGQWELMTDPPEVIF